MRHTNHDSRLAKQATRLLQTVSPITCVVLGLLLAACNPFAPTPSCLDFFGVGERPGFRLEGSSMALHEASGTVWFRCPAGMSFRGGRCQGQAMHTTWDGAMAYAAELSAKSGTSLRLPENRELERLTESGCSNPSLNPQVFGALEINNFWTSSRTLHNDKYRCSYYTQNGAINCREPRELERPFLLVRDKPPRR